MKSPKYIDTGIVGRANNKHEPARQLILELRNSGVSHKEIAFIIAAKYRISTTADSISNFCAVRFTVSGAKPKKKIMTQLHAPIKKLYLSGMDAEEISYALSSQEGADYTKQARAIATYIKNKGFKRPGETVKVCESDIVQGIKLITNKWNAEGLAGVAA